MKKVDVLLRLIIPPSFSANTLTSYEPLSNSHQLPLKEIFGPKLTVPLTDYDKAYCHMTLNVLIDIISV